MRHIFFFFFLRRSKHLRTEKVVLAEDDLSKKRCPAAERLWVEAAV